jgi:hypothetical protein
MGLCGSPMRGTPKSEAMSEEGHYILTTKLDMGWCGSSMPRTKKSQSMSEEGNICEKSILGNPSN